ncbi:MAG: RNA-binding protein [Maricaulaceae bacterium]
MTNTPTYPPADEGAPENAPTEELHAIDSEENWVDKRGHKGKDRRCLASGESRDAEDMIRFVLDPSGTVTPDISGKLPGRGVWVTATREAMQTTLKNGGFPRGFKTKAIIPDGLVDMVENLLSRRLLGLLTMARKSGHIHIGFDQVKAAAGQGNVAWRIEASDGAPDGRGKIRTLAKAVALELERPVPKALGCFSGAQLAEALGRETIIHLGLPRGKLAKSFTQDAKKLSGFRDFIPADWPDLAHEK